jgi:hypothetical protein
MMPAGYGSYYDITQSPDAVVIRYEMIHEARVIPLRGRWDGETLVVETVGFKADAAPQGGSENVKMTERFTATGPNALEWTATFEDASVWTRPWTFSMPLAKVDHTQQLHEYACHEGNLAMPNILSAARAAEAAARK